MAAPSRAPSYTREAQFDILNQHQKPVAVNDKFPLARTFILPIIIVCVKTHLVIWQIISNSLQKHKQNTAITTI